MMMMIDDDDGNDDDGDYDGDSDDGGDDDDNSSIFISVLQSFLLTGGPASLSQQDPSTHLLELNEPLGE